MTAADDAHEPDRWHAALEQVRCITQQYTGHQHLDHAGHEAAGRILAKVGASPVLLALAYVEAVDAYAQTKDPHDRAACVLLCHAHLDSLAAQGAAMIQAGQGNP